MRRGGGGRSSGISTWGRGLRGSSPPPEPDDDEEREADEDEHTRALDEDRLVVVALTPPESWLVLPSPPSSTSQICVGPVDGAESTALDLSGVDSKYRIHF